MSASTVPLRGCTGRPAERRSTLACRPRRAVSDVIEIVESWDRRARAGGPVRPPCGATAATANWAAAGRALHAAAAAAGDGGGGGCGGGSGGSQRRIVMIWPSSERWTI